MKFVKRGVNNGERVEVEAYRIFDKDFTRFADSYFCDSDTPLYSPIHDALKKDAQLMLSLRLSHKTEYNATDWFIRPINNIPTFEIIPNDEFMKRYEPCKQSSKDRNLNYSSSLYNKEDRISRVQHRISTMEKEFENQIEHSVKHSKIYSEWMSGVETGKHDTEINIILEGTTETLYTAYNNFEIKFTGDKIAILNFASYTNPGGGYLKGSVAQEEELCINSTLYNVLSKHREYYKVNRKTKNSGLYSNRILYTPDIVFMSDLTRHIKLYADVITCAAPNMHAVKNSKPYDLTKAYAILGKKESIMFDRIDHILNAAYQNHVEHLIIGPFGCGVFGNDPNLVAQDFKSLLTTKYKGVFKSVFISLPILNNIKNVISFWDVFSDVSTSSKTNIRKEVKMDMKQKFKKVLNENQKLDRDFKPNDIVRHFKGNLYQIVSIAEHTESGEKLVVYRALYPDKNGKYKTYARPYDMFISKVDTKKYPDEKQEYRFEKIYFEDVVNK